MQIKTLTTFDVYNYGASLQAYALMHFLKECGHEVEIIDYQPDYLTRKYDYMWVNPESSLSKWMITRILYRGLKYIQRQTSLKRKKAFDNFHSEYLIRTPHRYKTSHELYTNPPAADCFIVGSDQVWNVLYETGRDDSFFLNFVKSGKKIAYAASFSYVNLSHAQLDRIKLLLSTFSAIGVREYHGVKLLNDIQITSNWTLDPVFLIPAKEWGKIASKFNKTESYILIYDFENNKNIKLFAKEYAKKYHLKIYSINDTYPLRYADRNFNNAGPLEFISLIMHCDAFISNSFHGTAFSIMFNKPIFVFNRNRHNVNSRMESLLKLYGLSSFLYSEYSPGIINNISIIDYSAINNIIEIERKKSIKFLLSNI